MSLRVRNLNFRHFGRTVAARQRLIFLVIGVLTLITGIALANIVACMCGLVLAGAFAWDPLPRTPETAHVHLWQSLHKTPARRR